MKIEGNQKELDAMVEFHKGNRVEGLRLQEEFAAEFRKEYKDKDHCPCLKACRYHGNCKECVAIHRAHQEHVPNCMRPLINKKLKLMSELTEHTGKAYSEWKLNQDKEAVSEIDKKYQKLLETLSPEQEEVITEYCNAIFSSGAETEEFFYRLGLKDGLNLKNTVKSVLEMIS